jgi:hypothetical protein
MIVTTDIWFRTELDIRNLGDKLNLINIEEDAENFWEWIIGTFNGVRIDISREHSVPAQSTDTRIFVYERKKEFSIELSNELVKHLHALNISPVYLGNWISLSGNAFKKNIIDIKQMSKRSSQ